MEFFVSPASLEFAEGAEKDDHFLGLPLRRTAALNRLRPPAGVRGSVRMVFHCRP